MVPSDFIRYQWFYLLHTADRPVCETNNASSTMSTLPFQTNVIVDIPMVSETGIQSIFITAKGCRYAIKRIYIHAY